MRFIAFDIAKKTGFAVFDDSKLLAYGSHSFQFDTVQGWKDWKNFILGLCSEYSPGAIIYEEPFVSPKHFNAVMTLLRYIGGLIMVCVTELSLPVYNISIFDVRRTFCGSTKVNKDILQERIKKYIKLDLKDKDAIDAIGVGITHHLMKEAVEESTKQSSK